MSLERTLLVLAALLLLVLAAGPAGFQPPARADEEPPVGEEPAPTPAEPAAREPLHKVYVPYRELSRIFEKEGEGVFLPYDEFLSLWQRVHRTDEPGRDVPVRAAIRAAAYEGRAERDTLRIEATLEVEVLAEGWQQVALDLSGAGIEEAVLDGGEPALLLPAQKGYHLLLKEPGRRTLALVLRVPVVREGDLRGAEFSIPGVPLSRLALRLPGTSTEVEVTPTVASTTRPTEDGATELVAFLGPVERVRVTWRQKGEEAPAVEPLVFVDEVHNVRVDRGVIRSEMAATLSVLRAPLSSLRLRVPPSAVTLYVQGQGIRTWTRTDDGAFIDVELREPVRERWEIRVGLEQPLADLPASVALPVAALEGVERENGFLRILAAEGVKVEPLETPGLLQLDLAELPEDLRQAPVGRAFAYRFPARPGTTRVTVEALEPRLVAAAGQRLVLRPEGTEVRLVAQVTVERAGLFGVAFDLPDDLEVTAVRVAGIEKDDHKLREVEGRRVLAVEFRDRLLGTARVEVDGRRTTPLPDEEAEREGQEAEYALPLLTLRAADHVKGYVVLQVEAALEHRETARAGLVALDDTVVGALEPPAVDGSAVPVAGRYEHHEGDVSLTLALRRRAPLVTARVETSVRLEPDRLRLSPTLRYEIRYRGVSTLRFAAPLALDRLLHLPLEGARLEGPEPAPPGEGADEEAPRGIWTVTLPSARLGEVPLALEVDDLTLETLGSGQSRTIPVPTFVPVDEAGQPLANTVHHLAVRRDPLLEVAAEDLLRGEEIDARELPAPLQSEDNFLAFRSYEPGWALDVAVTRHDYEEVAEVVISHMHLVTVVAPEGRALTEAYLEVRNNDRQYLELRLPPGHQIRTLSVQGETRTPRETEREDTVLVPLQSGLGKDESFVVALSFDHDVGRSGALLFETVRLESPEPERVTADLLTWQVFVPANRRYTSFGGTAALVEPRPSWVASLIQRLGRTLGREAQGASLAADAAVRELMNDVVSPFATRHEGRSFLFHNRVGTGEVVITSADPTAFAFWKVLWFIVALVGTRLLVLLGARFAVQPTTVFAAVVLALLVLLVPAQPGRAQVLNAMLYGVLVAGLLSLLAVSARRRKEAAATARAAEEAAPAAAPLEGEPTAEGGAS